MSEAVRVLIWVQHLVGVGHQQRAAALARALRDAGATVCYVSGGLRLDGLDLAGCEFVQLPPARSLDMRYHTLVDAQGVAVGDDWRQRRRDLLLAKVEAFAPDVVITETWPFGRGLMRFELEPLMNLLARLEPRPLVMSSIRDIVERREDQRRYTVMVERVKAYFHAVLVHSDSSLMPFGNSFPQAEDIAPWLHHTGYIRSREPYHEGARRSGGSVLVSAGGGFFGGRLLSTAVQAASLEPADSPRRWHILAGPNLDEEAFARLRASARPHVIVERNRDDFGHLLDTAAVSVSQAGYNTTVDLLASRAPAVVVPYRDERETEQAVRAEHLARRGLVQQVDYEELDPERLMAAVNIAAGQGVMADPRIDLDGARNTASLVTAMARGRHPVAHPLGSAA